MTPLCPVALGAGLCRARQGLSQATPGLLGQVRTQPAPGGMQAGGVIQVRERPTGISEGLRVSLSKLGSYRPKGSCHLPQQEHQPRDPQCRWSQARTEGGQGLGLVTTASSQNAFITMPLPLTPGMCDMGGPV